MTKPFDLQAALAGASVQTRDGRPVTNIKHFPDGAVYKVAGVVKGELLTFTESGEFTPCSREYRTDLVMAPGKHKIWMNMYPEPGMQASYGYPTREQADKSAGSNRIACIEVEFEEGQGL